MGIFDLPTGANPAKDTPVGKDEMGRTIYQTGYGARYVMPDAPKTEARFPTNFAYEMTTPQERAAIAANPPAPQPEPNILSGTGIMGTLGNFNQMLNPVEAIGQSMSASQQMLAPETAGWDRVTALGNMLSGVAGVTAPAAAAYKAAMPAATALMESLLGWSPLRQTVVDRATQPGPMPTLYSNPIAGDVGRPPVTFADAERAMQETPGIRAYQGSPYNFAAERLVRMPDGSTQYIVGAPDVLPDVPAGAEVLQDFPLGRMRMDKLGTGEGAQAYGPGIYAAEVEDVAKTYRDTLSQNNRFTPYVTYKAEELLKDAGGDYAKAADAGRQLLTGNLDRQQAKELAEVVRLLDDKRVSSGSMYEVRINADPNAMLDWDKPLSEQPQTVKDLFEPRIEALRGAGMVAPQDPIGESLWRMAYPQGGFDVTDFSRSIPEQASERLLNAGIPGIKYLDQGSRSIGAGSRNFVVFDENLISIVRKYGIAGAAVMLGTSADQIAQTLTENMTQEELNNLVSGA